MTIEIAELDEKMEPQTEELKPEALKPKAIKIGNDDKALPNWVAKGVAAAKGWAPGKTMTQEEHAQKVQEFLNGPLYQEK
ncbi:MAG: hypothetical protein HUU55_07640 [Myxococcales bacterium]|nr:hypothetical protein [Myxococcales bacterium]